MRRISKSAEAASNAIQIRQKTTRQWLTTIQDPTIRKKALNNYKVYRIGKQHPKYKPMDMRGAIMGAFLFHETPEGSDYWARVAAQY